MGLRRRSHPDASVAARSNALGMTAQEAVDALLDREIAPADLPEAMALIASDRAASERLERMRSMFDDLRAPAHAPDVSGRVLSEVGARRRWLTPGLQRVVSAGRLALAACLLAAVAATLMAERVHPDAMLFGGPQPTPLASVVDAGRQEAAIGIQQVNGLLARPMFRGENDSAQAIAIGTLEPVDASGRILRLSVSPAPVATTVEGLIIDLTGRDCARLVRQAPAAGEGAASEEARWVLLPRSR